MAEETASNGRIGVLVQAEPGPGVLHLLTGVIAAHDGDIGLVEIIENRPPEARIYFEIELAGAPTAARRRLPPTFIIWLRRLAATSFTPNRRKRLSAP